MKSLGWMAVRYGLMIVAAPALAATVATMGLWAQVRPAQHVRFVGRVIDETRRPVDRAEVIVNRREVRATSDGFGIFHLDVVPGDSTVGFRRIGYRPLLLSINPLPPLGDTILVELRSRPVELPDVILTGSPSKPLRYAGTTKYDDVFLRRRVGLGSLITREAIDRRPGARTYQLLQGLAGIQVYDAPLGRIRFSRCQEPGGVTVWIDGVRQYSTKAGGPLPPSLTSFEPRPSSPVAGPEEEPEVEMLSRINPSDIEMIEVFRGPSEIPGVFHWNGCAVIAIWTTWNE
jgi:hypothetical protein